MGSWHVMTCKSLLDPAMLMTRTRPLKVFLVSQVVYV